jgi:WD40 repeat protein
MQTLVRAIYGVYSAAFSKDGKILVTSSATNSYGNGQGEINFWSVENGQLLHSYDPGAGVNNLALSPDDRFLVYGLWDGSVVVARNPYAPGR